MSSIRQLRSKDHLNANPPTRQGMMSKSKALPSKSSMKKIEAQSSRGQNGTKSQTKNLMSARDKAIVGTYRRELRKSTTRGQPGGGEVMVSFTPKKVELQDDDKFKTPSPQPESMTGKKKNETTPHPKKGFLRRGMDICTTHTALTMANRRGSLRRGETTPFNFNSKSTAGVVGGTIPKKLMVKKSHASALNVAKAQQKEKILEKQSNQVAKVAAAKERQAAAAKRKSARVARAKVFSQKTASGQPKMKPQLELILTRLEQEKAARRHRGN